MHYATVLTGSVPRVGIAVGVMVGYAVGSAVDGVGVVECVGLPVLPLSAAKAEAKGSDLIAAPRKLGRGDFGAAVTIGSEGATLGTLEGWSEDGTTEGEEVKARFGCSQLSGCTAADNGSADGPLLTSCGTAQALPHTPSSMNLRFSESHRQHVRWTSQSAVA